MITKKDLIVPTAEFGFRKPKIVKVDVRKTIFDEIKTDMDEFFTEIDKAIGRTPMTDEEAEHLEMKAELAHGI